MTNKTKKKIVSKWFFIFLLMMIPSIGAVTTTEPKHDNLQDLNAFDIIFETIPSLESTNDKLNLYIMASKKIALEKDFDKFNELMASAPQELNVYQRKLYETFFIEYSKTISLAKLKENLLKIDEKNLRDYIVEKIFFQALSEDEIENYDIFLPLITQTTIRSRASLILIEYFLKIKKLDKAKKLIEKIKFPAQKDQGLALMATAYANSADFEQSIFFLDSINDPNTKQETLLIVIKEFVNKSFYNIVFELINRIDTIENYEQALLFLINRYIAEEKIETAYQLLQSISNDELHDEALISFARAFAKYKDLDSINTILTFCKIPATKDKIFSETAHLFVKMGDVDKGFQIADYIKDKSTYNKTLISFAEFLGRGENTNVVILMLQKIKDVSLFRVSLEKYIFSLINEEKIDQLDIAIEYVEKERKDKILSDCLQLLIKTNQFEHLEYFQSKLSGTSEKVSYYSTFGQRIIFFKQSDYYQPFKESLETFLKRAKLDLFNQLQLKLIYANISALQNDSDLMNKTIDEVYKKLIKTKKPVYDELKIKLINVMIQQKEYKSLFALINSFDSDYKKINALFLIPPAKTEDERKNANKLILAFTKKINK